MSIAIIIQGDDQFLSFFQYLAKRKTVKRKKKKKKLLKEENLSAYFI